MNPKSSDGAATDVLMPIVYAQLKRIAQSYLRSERPGHTLQATALVNEAYLRLAKERVAGWENRAHFLSVAATQMRRILVDYARRRGRKKRGWDDRITLDEERAPARDRSVSLVALDEALEELAARDVRQSRLVELRYFAGLTIEEAAEVLDISPATVKRDWDVARAFLRSAMGRS